MSVIHVIDRVRAGYGRGLTALSIAEAQHRAGWDVRLLVSGVHDAKLLPAQPRPEALFDDPTIDVHRNMDAIEQVHTALSGKTNPHDTVACHEAIDLAAACRLTGSRIIGAVHSDPVACLSYLPESVLGAVTARTDHWIAWGSAIATKLCTLLNIDPGRITVSGQSVEPRSVSASRLRGSPACITVARIHPVKNHELMLDALTVLSQRWPDVHWHMVGGCTDLSYLRTLREGARRRGVDGRVTWHGYRDDATAMMLGSDVTVLSSHSEGVPRAIQEAILLAVPTVMPEALSTDLAHAGLPVTYRDNGPDALARAIELALSVDVHRRNAAARWVAQNWGWDRILDDWKSVVRTGS